jgi:hypothetical protein
MTFLTIWDNADGALAFDLKDLMALLAPEDLDELWLVSGAEVFDEQGVLNRLSDAKRPIRGRDLAASAQKVQQVVDGKFVCRAGAERPRIQFQAVDSTCWWVITDDQELLRRVRARFRDVREGEEND